VPPARSALTGSNPDAPRHDCDAMPQRRPAPTGRRTLDAVASKSGALAKLELGPISVEALIGRGGMADVFSGTHVRQNTPVAVKVITATYAMEPMFAQCFENEVQSVARLHHPGIVMVYDYGRIPHDFEFTPKIKLAKDSPYLVMEHAHHGALDRVKHTLKWSALRALLLSLLDALAHAHARGVLHRDIKPGNILVCGANEPRPGIKLTDFGIAHAMEREGVPSASEITGGTPLFMAPEQFDASWRDYGPWTDLYALGCLTFLYATGRPPFVGDHPMALAVSHLRKAPPRFQPEHAMPVGLEAWVLRCLEKDPRDRFRVAADAAWALRALGEPRDESAREREPSVLRVISAPAAPTTPNDAPPPESELSERTYTLVWDNALDRDTEELQDTITDLQLDLDETSGSEETSNVPDDILSFLDDTDDADATEAEIVLRRPDPLLPTTPPLPTSWRRPTPDGPPVHLMGAGLGLYGLRSIPMVGRDRERDLLWHALRLVRDDASARAVVLTGLAGTGKSRLVEWIAQRAVEVGSATVLRATHGPHGSPTEGLPRMVARFLRCTDLERPAVLERSEEVLRRLGATDPYEWQVLTELITPAPLVPDAPLDSSPAALTIPEGRERHAIVLRLIERLTEERPVILWLDDVHYSPDAIQFARFVLNAQNKRRRPVLLLLTAREELLVERALEAKLLDSLLMSPRVGKLEVEPLPLSSHEELVEGLLGLNRHVAHLVAQRTNGNPQYAVQLVGDWVHRGVLTLGDSGFSLVDGESTALPAGMHEVWTKRVELILERHEASQRTALEIAAILGRDVDQIEWEAASKKAGVKPSPALIDDLATRRLAQKTELGFSFSHNMLRETLERIAREQKRYEGLHQLCAEMLYERYGTLTRGMAERIGRHYLAGGCYKDALSPLLRGANERFAASEYLETEELLRDYERALEAINVPKADPRWSDCWVLRARVATVHGRFEEATSWATRAENNARRWDRTRVVAEALRERAQIAYHRGEPEEALDLYQGARKLFEELEDSRGVARCQIGTGDVRYRLGNLAGAADRYLDALTVVGSSSNTMESASALWGLGYVALWRGRPDRARGLFNRQRRIAERTANRHAVARCLNGLAEVARIEGELTEADRLYAEAIEIFDAVGSPESQVGQLNRGLVLLARDEAEEARKLIEGVRPSLEAAHGRVRLLQLHAMMLPIEAAMDAWTAYDAHFEIVKNLLEASRLVDGDVAWSIQLGADAARKAGQVERAVAGYRVTVGMWRTLTRDRELAQAEQALGALGA
jgi:serine/threonine protein kinase/tetratricopeptide (TPR) repeat protein